MQIQQLSDGKPTSKAMQDQQDGCIRSHTQGVAAPEPVQGNAATVRTCEQLSVVVGVAGQATKSCRATRAAGPQSERQCENTHKQAGRSRGLMYEKPKAHLRALSAGAC